MILELLQPDPNPWDALAVVVRAGYNFAALSAAGLALFLSSVGLALDETARAEMRRLLARLALFGIALSVLALFVRAAQLSGGEDIFDETIWAAMLRGRVGDAFAVRLVGFVLLLASVRGGVVAAPIGAFLIAASYAGMGHSTLYNPRQELAALVTVHLLAVSFWVGSLPALIAAARRDDAALIRAWSRTAMFAVAVMFATGAALIFYLVGRVDLLLASWYGWALIAKLILVAGLMGFAIRHKLSATPALERGDPGAGQALARSIALELALAALVCYAAAELVAVHPLDYGHRIAS